MQAHTYAERAALQQVLGKCPLQPGRSPAQPRLLPGHGAEGLPERVIVLEQDTHQLLGSLCCHVFLEKEETKTNV